MTAEATAIAKVLLRHHSQRCRAYEGAIPKTITDTAVEQSVIFYGSICERAGVPFLTHGVGRFLGEIAEWCDENAWPPLNSLAVNRATGMPGMGYDGAPGSDLLHWPEAVRQCIVFDGYPENRMNSPTYAEIAKEVERIGGFVPKTCWIAHVKSDLGLTTRTAPNRMDPRERKHPCPPEKRPVIVEAIRKLAVI